MDPNANLEEQLRLAARIIHLADTPGDNGARIEAGAIRLAELVEALDGWINKGGFLPLRWASLRPARPVKR